MVFIFWNSRKKNYEISKKKKFEKNWKPETKELRQRMNERKQQTEAPVPKKQHIEKEEEIEEMEVSLSDEAKKSLQAQVW